MVKGFVSIEFFFVILYTNFEFFLHSAIFRSMQQSNFVLYVVINRLLCVFT